MELLQGRKRSRGKKVQLDQCHTIGTDRDCEWSKPNRLCNFCERLSIFTPKEPPEGAVCSANAMMPQIRKYHCLSLSNEFCPRRFFIMFF